MCHLDSTVNKIKKIRSVLPSNVLISIDGGVNDKTLEKVKEAKCDMLVSGSYITSSDDYEKRVLSLK